MKKIKLFLAAFAAMVGLSAQAQLTDGTVYWLQDTGTGQFLSQGDDWSTKAVTKDVGGLGFEAVYVSDGVYKLNNIMWNTIRNASVGLGSDAYVDQTPAEFTLTSSGVGYLISTGGNYLVNNGTANAYKERPIGKTTDASAATVWKFLTKSEYDTAIQAYKDGKAASYAATMGYNSITSVSALEDLITDADQFISKDYTSSITNANFSSWDGWSHGTVSQRGTGAGGVGEFWNGCGYATQTVANLPNGLYKVTFAGTYRPGSNSITFPSEKTSSPAFVYANDAEIEFVHWIDVPAKANGVSGITAANGYGHTIYTYVTDGNLALGVVADAWLGDNGYIWTPFRAFTLTYYTDQVSDDDITALVATIPAEESIPAGVYSNLTSLKNTLESGKTIAAFNNLSSAIDVAKALVAPYALLLTEISKAKALGIAAADAEAYANVTTAAEATANTQALMVDEYNYVATTYQYAVDLGAWNASDNAGTMSSQHWDGTAESTYLEQGSGNKAYNLNSWTVNYDQNLNLPAGNYVFKVAGRTASDHVTINLNVTNVSNSNELLGTVNDFPKGDVGLGINKAGATSFDPADAAGFANNGNGRGWQWRYVKFTLAEAATVKVAVVATADAQYRWMGFCNATVQTDDEANVSLIAYNIALNNAQTVLADATYTNVAGTDKSNLQAAIAADASLDKTDADAIDAATATLNTAATTFTAGVASWNSLANARAAASGELPYASATKKTALDNAVAAEATDAADAAAKVAAIEQANRQYVESNALAEGVTGAVNVTNLITNPDATDGGNGWSGEFGTLDGEPYTQGDGTQGGAYFDKNGASSYTAEQTIANLATGKYLLTVTARAQSISGSYQVKATNSQDVAATGDIATIGNQGGVFGRGWGDASVEFLQKIEGNATIGITASNEGNFWMSFDRFRLVKLRDLTPEEAFVAATTEDYAALTNAINAAEAKTIGFDAGDYAPYNNAAAIAALAAAKAIDQDAENAQEDVQAATTALTGATWTANTEEVNAVYDGDFTIQSVPSSNTRPIGWSRHSTIAASAVGTDSGYETRLISLVDGVSDSDKGMMTKHFAFYGEQSGYEMPLKAQTSYILTFKYCGYNEQPTLHVNVYGSDGTKVAGSTSYKTKDNKGHQQASSWTTFTFSFKTTDAGNYVIGLIKDGGATSQQQAAFADIVLKKVPVLTISEEDTSAPTAVDYANVTLTRTLKGGQWNGFSVPFGFTIAGSALAGAEVKEFASVTDNEIALQDATEIVAGNPYLVKPASDDIVNPTFEGVNVTAAADQTMGTGDYTFQAHLYATDLATNGSVAYMSTSDSKIKKLTSGSIKGLRAIFNVPTSSEAKALVVRFDNTPTGILTLDAEGNVFEGAIYNLAGQKLSAPVKGINIIGGKKVVVK